MSQLLKNRLLFKGYLPFPRFWTFTIKYGLDYLCVGLLTYFDICWIIDMSDFWLSDSVRSDYWRSAPETVYKPHLFTIERQAKRHTFGHIYKKYLPIWLSSSLEKKIWILSLEDRVLSISNENIDSDLDLWAETIVVTKGKKISKK